MQTEFLQWSVVWNTKFVSPTSSYGWPFFVKIFKLSYLSLSTIRTLTPHNAKDITVFFSILVTNCQGIKPPFDSAVSPTELQHQPYMRRVRRGSLSFAQASLACAKTTPSLQLHSPSWELVGRVPCPVLPLQSCLLAQHEVWRHPVPVRLLPASLHNPGCLLYCDPLTASPAFSLHTLPRVGCWYFFKLKNSLLTWHPVWKWNSISRLVFTGQFQGWN